MERNFILYSDCIPVKGANRSVICDTQKKTYYYIPNGLYEIVNEYNGTKISEIKKKYNYEFDEIIDEYFNFLFENKLVFSNDNVDFFPKIKLDFYSNAKITNIIVDFDLIKHDLNSVIKQIESLKCSYLQLRFYNNIGINELEEYVKLFAINKSRIRSINVILPFYKNFNIDEVKSLFPENQRLDSLVFYNSPTDFTYDEMFFRRGNVMLTKKNIIKEHNCGIISLEYLNPSLKLISESQSNNTCLNRKISIDKYGNIKNCPSMKESFGNIKDTTLEEALNHPNFKKYWSITKDQITVCKDCEFRHICTDCRAYVENPEDQYSKPLKCGYNPYTNVWEEWSTNPLKQKAIEFYGMQELIKNNA